MFEISHYGVWPGSRHRLHLGDKQSHLLHVLCGDDGGGLALMLPHLGVGQEGGVEGWGGVGGWKPLPGSPVPCQQLSPWHAL